jgi:hypothetical protein
MVENVLETAVQEPRPESDHSRSESVGHVPVRSAYHSTCTNSRPPTLFSIDSAFEEGFLTTSSNGFPTQEIADLRSGQANESTFRHVRLGKSRGSDSSPGGLEDPRSVHSAQWREGGAGPRMEDSEFAGNAHEEAPLMGETANMCQPSRSQGWAEMEKARDIAQPVCR